MSNKSAYRKEFEETFRHEIDGLADAKRLINHLPFIVSIFSRTLGTVLEIAAEGYEAFKQFGQQVDRARAISIVRREQLDAKRAFAEVMAPVMGIIRARHEYEEALRAEFPHDPEAVEIGIAVARRIMLIKLNERGFPLQIMTGGEVQLLLPDIQGRNGHD